jgi:hypothetical protein
MEKHLTLLIPALTGRQKALLPEPALIALPILLARADRLNIGDPAGFERQLFDAFGINTGQELPVAAVTRVFDTGRIESGWWLRADPVYLQVDRDRLVLADNETLRISQQEADSLIGEILKIFAQDGWRLEAPHPNRWYLKVAGVPEIQTRPLSEVVGQDIQAYLPTGGQANTWRRALNEVQMLLHAAPVNTERAARGELEINSLWFWGSGDLPAPPAKRWAQVWSVEPISLGLARLSATPYAPLPANGNMWLQQAITQGRHLAVLDQGRGAIQYRDVQGWHEFLQQLDVQWVQPLLRGLRQKQVQSVTVYGENGAGFYLTAKHLGRWWRRRRPLPDYFLEIKNN